MQSPAEIPLAIVGMSCRVPGADNLDEYWQLLMESRTALGELPHERLDRSLYYDPKKGIPTKSYTTLGGMVPARPFDDSLCPRPGKMEGRTHEAHLKIVEVAAAAVRRAGYDPFHMPKLTTGVYVGHTPPSSLFSRLTHARLAAHTTQYLHEVAGYDALVGPQSDGIMEEILTSLRSEFPEGHPTLRLLCNAHHGSAVIAQSMKLDGPCMSFDAACASSMRALAHAGRALQLGQIDMAIVGGASYCHTDTLILFSAAQSLTAQKSRPFDENADGLIASEAYAIVLVKTLERALADGDNIQAVVRGIGLSSDGKGKSLWAPRPEGQIEAVRRAYPQGLSPAKLQYIEAHATSTQLGDATELGALNTAIGDQIPAGKKVIVGSVKGNIGHSLETAGVASIVKTVLAMQHATVPPQCGLETPNANVSWDNIPFVVPREPMAWPEPEAGEPKCAAVNAFGIGGLNVHVILQEHVPETSQALVKAVPGPAGGRILHVAAEGPLPQRDGVAIIGMGAILPGARTVEALWDLFHAARDMRIEAPEERWVGGGPNKGVGTATHWDAPTRVGGFITDFVYDWKKHKVPPKQVQSADPLQFMLLDATDQALKNAGFDKKPFDRTRTGVVVGTVFGGEFADQLQMGLRLPEFQRLLRKVMTERGIPAADAGRVADEFETVLLKHMPALVDETGSFTASTLSSRLTKTFDLMGGAVAVDASDASALAALSNCVDMLLAGDVDMMICASGQRNVGYGWFLSMNRNGVLSNGAPVAPFDSRSTGGVPGEGAGVLVLKRLADAQRDGDRIHGIIRGIGAGNHEDLFEVLKTAMTRGLQSANLRPNQVSLIEAGATGCPEDDRKELEAIVDTYSAGPRDEPLFVGSPAGQLGHAAGASGMVNLMKAVTELNHAEIPPIVGLDAPLAPSNHGAAPAQPVLKASRLKGLNDDGKLYAGVNACSTCNGAYHVIVEGMTRVPRETPAKPAASVPAKIATPKPAPSKSVASPAGSRAAALTPEAAAWKIVRLSGASLEEVLGRANEAAAAPEAAFASGAGLNDIVAGASPPFRASDRCRLAIVAKSSAELAELCGLAVKQVAKPEARGPLSDKGIFYSERSARPRVAFLYPGQGSQYSGMLKALVTGFAPAADAMATVDAVLAKLQLPSFADIAWGDADRLGTDVWITQLALLAADTIVSEAVRAIGLKGERLGGHSFGELVALVAAGTWTFEDAVKATSARCAAIEGCRNAKGALLSTTAPSAVADQVCREIGGEEVGRRIYVSHYNAPDQTVVGGDPPIVALASEKLAAAGYRAKILDVPAAFHTPLMEETKQPFGAALNQIPMDPPSIPLLSSVTNKYVADPADIRDNLVVQMTQPVHWVELITRLHREGFNVFVEVGPKQVLTGLHRQILAGQEVATVSTDHAKRDGIQQLMFARACVEASGALDQPVEAAAAVTAPAPKAAAEAPKPAAAAKPAQPVAKAQAEAAPVVEKEGSCRIVRLGGSPFEMGRRHGVAEAENIRRVLRRYADLVGTRWDVTAQVEEALAHTDTYFSADELEELRGIAKGAEVTLSALVAHNLRLYLDVGSGGLHFAVRSPSEAGILHGANEDIQRALCVRDCLERHVQVRTPAAGLPHLAFCVVGQVGTLNGINAAGLAVSTTALVDVNRSQPAPRTLHTVLVKHILERADSIDAAIAVIREERSAGAWSICLSHQASDRLCYVEFDGQDLKVMPSRDNVVAANHRLMGTHVAAQKTAGQATPVHSRNRLERLKELLGGAQLGAVSAEQVQSALRDKFDPSRGKESDYPTLNTIRRVDNQISVLMQPAKDRVWVTAGPLANGHSNDFHCLKLSRLLPKMETAPKPPAPATTAAPTTSVPSKHQVSRRDLAFAYAAAGASHAQSSDVCQRYVLRIADAPLKSGESKLTGPVIVAGSNAVAEAIRVKLKEAGAAVLDLLVTPQADIDAVQAELASLFATASATHLILATAFGPTQSEGDLRAATANATTAFFLTQRWFQLAGDAGLLDQSTLTAITSMGGDFGLAGRFDAVENGGLSGLVKGIEMEVRMTRGAPNFRSKVIDFAPTAAPAFVADAVLREFTATDDEQEVGYVETRRVAARPLPQSVPAATQSPPQGAVFVVTGGARGVTAAVARELGQRFGVRLHLIGASPIPQIPDAWKHLVGGDLKDVKAAVMKEALAAGQKPADAWSRFEKAMEIDKTLREFAAAGISATYHACDVGNRDSLAAVLEEVRRTDGPIAGVIHGAGFERACRFEKKQRDLVERTLSAKVDGAANLIELTKNDPVRWFAAFGSVAGRFGGVGQADYCVANEMLAKLMDWHRARRPECASAVFHWHAWDDVGMAVRPESQHIRKLHNIKFMPAVEGVRHLLDELQAGLPESEVAITELEHCMKRFGGEPAADETCDESSAAASAAALALIDRIVEKTDGQSLVAEIDLDPTRDVFLVQHLFKRRPMMPVVASVEALTEAATHLAAPGEQAVAVHDIEIITGLRFPSDATQTVRIHARREGSLVDCTLTADVVNRKGQVLQKDKPYLKAKIELATEAAPLTAEYPPPQEQWFDVWYPEEDVVIWHGTPFRCLRQMTSYGEDCALGTLVAPAPHELSANRSETSWLTPAALLDACFFAGGVFLWHRHQGVVAIPDGIDAIRLGQLPAAGEKCLMVVRDHGRDGQKARYDITLFGEQGQVIAAVDGYRNVIVAEEPAHAT